MTGQNAKLDDVVREQENVSLSTVTFNNELYFKISNSDEMRPFFMSIVSDSNHWMFISSNGGLTAGRRNAEYALFPYYTDDKITESSEITGSKSIFRVVKNNQTHVWEPFSIRSEVYNTTRNLYKNKYGNKVIFEEINHDLDLSFNYQWCSSDEFGFVRTSQLTNNSTQGVSVELLDGIQNIVPAKIGSDIQNASSNLVDAYKRNELDVSSGLGIYALSAILVDKAEASEALKTNIVWSIGLNNPTHLVSSIQIPAFRKGYPLEQETDVKAEKGAYFVSTKVDLIAQESKSWKIVADVNKNHSQVAKLIHRINSESDLETTILKSIDLGTSTLIQLNAAADGLQCTSDNPKDSRHFSNTLFNIMRGGIFDNNYQIEKPDFKAYLKNANHTLSRDLESIISELPEEFTLTELHGLAQKTDSLDFSRLCLEYLPLKFSRRHGDPSRPWNKFSINTKNEDGSKLLDYEGNWRDIFQNWEALALSYPNFIESMIHKFLNASTFDGYNPYRVTKGGFDWETIEPDDPWSYIGYWGDHQIIYLLKFLEFIEDHNPSQLESLFDKELFVYANVPYKIKGYQDLLKNPKDTIEFDVQLDKVIRQERSEQGADGALLKNQKGQVVRANFIEKILATSLAKLSNFIPEGGIWMNTQRPEWNDANNALVGNGVSMVTLYYLRRFFNFFDTLLASSNTKEVTLSSEISTFFHEIQATFNKYQNLLSSSINDTDRKAVLDSLGNAGSTFRNTIYSNGFSGEKEVLSIEQLQQFIAISKEFLEHSIDANKREDGLYHAYNLMTVNENNTVSISYLSEMLEGQVAVLSSGYLTAENIVGVLDSMKQSKLFREDQYSYLLYPYKNLKGFLDRNNIPSSLVNSSGLLQELVQDGHTQIIEKDINGNYHFNGNFRNADDVSSALNKLEGSKYESLISSDASKVLSAFEEVFNHKEFTGRSGTFYGYEGLGSIYWHMVSKLLLAVQECAVQAINNDADASIVGRLLEHFYEINEGIGVHKPPTLYGAFPTDPYSHTPGGKGAQQPGMTGQVKEDVLSRFGELGVFVNEGEIVFNPCLLRKTEFINQSKTFQYYPLNGSKRNIQLGQGSLGFTYCQVPIIYHISNNNSLEIYTNDGGIQKVDELTVGREVSQSIFERTGKVTQINVFIEESQLK